MMLDLNQNFNYGQPSDNQYYLDAIQYHEFYIITLNQLAAYHCYYKLERARDSKSSFEEDEGLREAIAQYKALMGEDIVQENLLLGETVKS